MFWRKKRNKTYSIKPSFRSKSRYFLVLAEEHLANEDFEEAIACFEAGIAYLKEKLEECDPSNQKAIISKISEFSFRLDLAKYELEISRAKVKSLNIDL
jgi:hypothetical protein